MTRSECQCAGGRWDAKKASTPLASPFPDSTKEEGPRRLSLRIETPSTYAGRGKQSDKATRQRVRGGLRFCRWESGRHSIMYGLPWMLLHDNDEQSNIICCMCRV